MDFIEIGTLFSSDKHFIIPDYQREYSWGKEQKQPVEQSRRTHSW